MSTNFSDYVNRYRVIHFLREVDNGKLDQLTISGLMNECGFSSKATFYRAFKKIKGCTPTGWLKSQQ
jgi:AraC-like DNA-binding protein